MHWDKQAAYYLISRSIISIFLLASVLHGRTMIPGVYREYTVETRQGNDWRVTDPGVSRDDAKAFLPNPVFQIEGVDLTDASQVKLTMHHWAGHGGTEGQQIIINGEHRLDVPLNEGFENRRQHLYLNCDNPVLDVPLDWLQSGTNTFEGTIAEELQGKHWWGQWGWYWFKLRVYVDSTDQSVPDSRIVVDAPGKRINGKTLTLSLESEEMDQIQSVQYYAKYVGFDENGDGATFDWHGFDDLAQESSQNVGGSQQQPFVVDWDVSWIPDQPGTISFIAVLQLDDGLFRVTQPVEGFSIERDYSVKLIQAISWPTQLIRNGTVGSAPLFVPGEYPLESVEAARLVVRTWNGRNNEAGSTPVKINESGFMSGIITGKDHYYGYDNKPVPVELLIPPHPSEVNKGRINLQFTSTTKHHGSEILAPGPCLLLRWPTPQPDYLHHAPPPAPGWYVGMVGWVYFFNDNQPWLWSPDLDWLYAHDLSAESGWQYSPLFGFIWTSRTAYPWMFSDNENRWLYFVRRDATDFLF